MAHGTTSHHIVPLSSYYKVFGFLLVMTAVTVGVSSHVTGVHMGALSALIAMAIATAKALSVMAIFMHLKYEGMLNRAIFGSAFFFLVVLYFFSAVDYFTRVFEKSPL